VSGTFETDRPTAAGRPARPRPHPVRTRLGPGPALGALAAAGILLHLLQITAPFGFAEGNVGSYFGCVAKGYREVGWLAVRGAPFMPDLYGGLTPYLHHPPAGFWLAAALGPREWHLRTMTMLAHVAAMLALVGLLRPALGTGRALLAGAVFLVLPVFYIDISGSQWPHTIACGLWLLLAFTRWHAAGSARWRALTLLAAFVGPWIDWHFGFFCLALVPLALPWRGALCRLLLPAVVSCASLGLFLLWRDWAAQAPVWSAQGAEMSNADLVSGTILTRPPLLAQLRGMLRCSGLALTWPALAGGALGLVATFRRAPRLAGALLTSGLLGSLLFGHHVQSHTDFPSMLGPAIAAGVASLFPGRRLGLGLGLLVLALAGWQGLQRVRASRTTFFRDYGQAATAATREQRTDGGVRRFVVASDTTWTYRYYIDSADFLVLPVFDPGVLEQNRAAIAQSQGKGVRFLTLRYGGAVGATWPRHPALEEYLARFPAVRLPALEQAFAVDGEEGALRIEQALLVTIEP
jgi:hypothetical protein